ncbi:sirohydrochlorin chelatase [Bacillus sp. Marseille-P3661]|uniref:sirohydrochlorin chelatase n=1 Tax=Bacillus sp. Marseille-P3661 TaxID=1936234 RepID=UPI000C8660F1|nr:sirohydrochlorin chelatase [Bacillus sp. Marseille-P3661]
MDGVLYVFHGSRMKKATEFSIQFVKKCMEIISIPIQEHCFLELAAPSMKQGIDSCVKRGATRIAVVPILLLTAAHAKKDIPEEIERLRELYPEVEIMYGRPFGVHEKIIEILIERIIEKKKNSKEMDVLLVGRGSTDSDSKNDMERIATLLQEKIDVNSITCCYLAAVDPAFEIALEQTIKKSGQVVVLPYVLFTGLLMNRMQKAVKEVTMLIDKEIVLCDYLGYHPNLSDIIRERVWELLGEEEKVCSIG